MYCKGNIDIVNKNIKKKNNRKKNLGILKSVCLQE